MDILQCYGEKVTVLGLSPEELGEVSRLVGFQWHDSEGEYIGHISFRKRDGSYRLEVDGTLLADSTSLKFLAEILKVRLIKKVAASKPELLFLQADVVRTAAGEAVAIVGSGVTGKSRLAQAFIYRGARPWSTDVAVLDSQGDLLAFPSAELPESGLPPSAILMIGYEHGAELAIEEPSAGQTVLNLTAAQLLPSDNQSKIFARLGLLATRSATRFSGRRGDSASTVAWFAERLSL